MGHCAIRIALPCNVVAQQVLELGETWLADAVRKAVSAGESPQGDVRSGVAVRVGRPGGRPDALVLPMEWELAGAGGAVIVRGELAVVPAGRDEALIRVSMASPPQAEAEAAKLGGRTPLEELIDRAGGSLLQRLFWTMEALDHYRVPPHGAQGESATRSRTAQRPR